MRSRSLIGLFLIAACAAACGRAGVVAGDPEAAAFASPPASARPWTYWYWHIPATRESITRDFEAMRAQGIEGVLVFPFKEYMKPAWIPLFEHILGEAERLSLKIVLNNDTGWSFDVPWMTPELAQKKLICAERVFEGGRPIEAMIAAPATETGFYRDILVLACRLEGERIKEIPAALEEKAFKTGNKMRPSYATGDLDVFYAKSPDTPAGERVPPASVLDISGRLEADGTLKWDAPAGRWLVLRFGYTILNKECLDFFDRRALDHHLAQSVEKLLPLAGKRAGSTWTHVHEDSYENGRQTWTPAFREEFRARRGYDMTPWMPALAGRVVDSPALSDRFLHDYRRTISDLYAENHFGYFAERLRDLGLAFSTEGGYGWASAIADGLRIEATAGVPMGEAWHAQKHPVTGERLEHQFKIHFLDPKDPTAHRAIPYGFGLNSIRLAASAAHIYGKPFSQAETFTSYTDGGYDAANSPFSIKATGDRAFCDGLGRVVFHVYDLQPDADGGPGYIWPGVGIHFNRNTTWWTMGRAFADYLARCQFFLQRGKFVADFAYWTGDTVPYECPDRIVMRPALPRGCNADLMNTDALLNRVTVVDGRLTLPEGISYSYLVLPPTRDTAEPASLRKIKDLVEAGATVVLGPRPASAAGLGNYPACDEEVKELADAIWGTGAAAPAGERVIGKGRAVWGRDLAALLERDGVPQDLAVSDETARPEIEWIHYRDGAEDIYFVSNQSDRDISTGIRFRVTGRTPVLWDPVRGSRRTLPERQDDGKTTIVPMRFAARQSYFVIFGPRGPKAPRGRNFPAMKSVSVLAGAWDVAFDPKRGGPASAVFATLEDWTNRPEEGIRFYSGTATYRKAFDLPEGFAAGPGPVYLDLGTVRDLAEVRLNGKRIGVVWTAPWRIDIGGAVKAKGNALEIDVVNEWPNRLIGDSGLPEDKRIARHNAKGKTGDPVPKSGLLGPWKPGDALVPSGLLGPVTLQVEE